MTSNFASPLIQEAFARGRPSPESWAALDKRVRQELKRAFRPEFLNRLDDIILFHPLDADELAGIVDIQLRKLDERLLTQHLSIDVDPDARSFLAREGTDPQFGARPLKRAIQQCVLDPLAMRLLEGAFKSGDRIRVRHRDGALHLDKG